MNERVLNPSDCEPVSTEQVRQELLADSAAVCDTLTKAAVRLNYSPSEVSEDARYTLTKGEILAQGIVPAADHSFLWRQIDTWFGMTETPLAFTNDIQLAKSLARKFVDGVEAVMVSNNLLSEDAKGCLVRQVAAAEINPAEDAA